MMQGQKNIKVFCWLNYGNTVQTVWWV